MNRERLKNAVLLLAAAVLLLDSVWIGSMRSELRSLQGQLSNAEQSLKSSLQILQSETNSRFLSLESSLKKEQSLFSAADADYGLEGNKIAVSLHVVPKELSEDEVIIARVYAGDRIYEKQADEDGRAKLLVDMAETVTPVLLIKSDRGLRQEALEETYTGNLFDAEVYSVWGDSYSLVTYISPYERELPFDPEKVAKAEYVVVNSGELEVQNGSGAAEAVAIEAPYEDVIDIFNGETGERLSAVMMHGANTKHVEYSGDFSRYADRKDGFRYDVYLCLTMEDGTRFYTPSGSTASFAAGSVTATMADGNGQLVPIYEKK